MTKDLIDAIDELCYRVDTSLDYRPELRAALVATKDALRQAKIHGFVIIPKGTKEIL